VRRAYQHRQAMPSFSVKRSDAGSRAAGPQQTETGGFKHVFRFSVNPAGKDWGTSSGSFVERNLKNSQIGWQHVTFPSPSPLRETMSGDRS
jgi:hypothetical protein